MTFPIQHPKTTATRNRKKGFSSVEALMGAVLMTTLITSMLHMLSQGNHLVGLARDQTRVTQILQNEIEDLRTLNWSDLEKLEDWEPVEPQGTFTESAENFYCYRGISNTDTNQKEIVVIAVWYDSMNRLQSSYFRTLFTKNGLNDYYYRAA